MYGQGASTPKRGTYNILWPYTRIMHVTAAGLAQSVERLTAEREVAGSIPGAGPILRVLK